MERTQLTDQHDERVRAVYAMRLHEMVDRFLEVIRRFPRPNVPDLEMADLRKRLHGILEGISIFALEVEPDDVMSREFGEAIHGLCDGSRHALVEIKSFLDDALLGNLPDDLRETIAPRVAPMLATVMYGYIERDVEERIAASSGLTPRRETTIANDDLYQRIVEQHPFGIFTVDLANGQLGLYTPGMTAFSGFTREEEVALRPEDFRTEETPEDDFDLLAAVLAGRVPFVERESARRHKDGRSVRFRMLGWPVRDDEGTVTHLAHMIRSLDPNERIGTRAELSEKRIRYLSRLSSDPIIVVSDTLYVRYASPSVEPVLGYDPDALIGRHLRELLSEDSVMAATHLVQAIAVEPRQSRTAEIAIRRNDGSARLYEVIASNLTDVPEIDGIVLQARDISERKELERQLRALASTDPLTKVLNRRGFLSRLEAALAQADRHDRIRLCSIDLDLFKRVNDRYGHAGGDRVLEVIASRLASVVGDRGEVGRMGGDEFLVLLTDVPDGEVNDVLRAISTSLEEPIAVDGGSVRVGGSVGEARVVSQDATANDLLRAADHAMYARKARRDRRETYALGGND